MSDKASTATVTETAEAPQIESGDFASEVLKTMGMDNAGRPLPQQKQETEVKPETKTEVKSEAKTDRKDLLPEQLFEKKETTPESTIDRIEAPELRGDRSKKSWEELKGAAKTYEKKAMEFEAKVAELTKQVEQAAEGSKRESELQARLEAATKQAAEYQSLVQKVNIDIDPEFRRTYVDGRSKLIQEARQIAQDAGLDPSTIEAALNLKGKPRSDAMRVVFTAKGEDDQPLINPFDVSRIGQVIQSIDRLDTEAQEKRGNPQEYFQQQERTFRERQEAEQKKVLEESSRAFRNAQAKLDSELIVLRKLEGDENKDWNAQGDAMRTDALKFWETNQDPQLAAEKIIKGFAAERYERAYVDMRGDRDSWKEKAQKFEKELEGLYSTGPKLGAHSTAVKDGKPADWADAVIQNMNTPRQ